MTSRENIKRILNHDSPERFGFDFMGNNPTDFEELPDVHLIHPEYSKYKEWGTYPELMKKVGDFPGEVRVTPIGNIFGRLEQKTGGECIKGALQDGWELFDDYVLPEIDTEFDKTIDAQHYKKSDKYVLSGLGYAVFSSLRDTRHMDNALMDTLLEQENVLRFEERMCELSLKVIRRNAALGADGVIIYDDLGMQHAPFFSLDVFRSLFKPFYKLLADEIHKYGMKFFVHSCGFVHPFVPDFIDAGVDAFQFDQPELTGSEVWARDFGDKVSFYCPVDIQKIMATGDRKTIEDGALCMLNNFKKYCHGSLIIKDYGNWQDIDVLPEWQQWARDIVIANADLR